MARVHRNPVRDVEHRVRDPAESEALLRPDRRAGEPLFAKRLPGRAERAGDDELVAGPRARAAGYAPGVAESRHGDVDAVRARGVAAPDGHLRLRETLVELDDTVQLDVSGHRERDEEGFGAGGRRREVADVDRGGPEAELAPGQPVEPEVHVLDQRVLGDDEAALQLSRVVLDADDQPALLELA